MWHENRLSVSLPGVAGRIFGWLQIAVILEPDLFLIVLGGGDYVGAGRIHDHQHQEPPDQQAPRRTKADAIFKIRSAW